MHVECAWSFVLQWESGIRPCIPWSCSYMYLRYCICGNYINACLVSGCVLWKPDKVALFSLQGIPWKWCIFWLEGPIFMLYRPFCSSQKASPDGILNSKMILVAKWSLFSDSITYKYSLSPHREYLGKQLEGQSWHGLSVTFRSLQLLWIGRPV